MPGTASSTLRELGPPAWRRRASDEGFTLVEMLVVVLLSVVVIAGTSDFIITSVRQANAASSRTVAATRAELVLGRMTRELREAQKVTNSSTGANETPVNVTYKSGSQPSSSVSFYRPVPGSTAAGTRVTWTCESGSCTRTEGAGAPMSELTGVSSATFTPYGSNGTKLESGAGSTGSYPSTVQVALTVKNLSQTDSEQTHTVSGDSTPVTIRDGVYLRNYS